MEQKDKELLLKDLCDRLPYGVRVTTNNFHNLTLLGIKLNRIAYVIPNNGYLMEINWRDCKPYLFPLSSMTDEQREEYYNLCSIGIDEYGDIICFNTYESIDYLNKNHFDYRNLIPLGLAIDATNLNIY